MNYPQWLWKNSRGSRLSISASIAIGTVYTALGLLMVWLSRQFIDSTIRSGTSADIVRMVVWLTVIAVAGVTLRQLSYWLMTMADIRLTNALRLRIFHSLFHRSLFGSDPLHSGDVSSRLAKDIEQVSKVMTDTLPQIAVTAIQITGAFLLLRWFDPRLAWALIILTPIAIASGKLISRRLRRMTLAIRQDESQVQMQVQEAMENNAVLRSLGSEPWLADRLNTLQSRLKDNMKRRTRFTVAIRLIMGCSFSLGYLLAFVWGGIGLREGTITFGVMTSFLQLVGMIQHPILQLLNKVPEVIHATASIDRLDELETGERWESRVGKSDDGSVRLKGVTFGYAENNHAVFDKFSHVFEPGSKTAIMGETGIGKTTLFPCC